MKEHKKTHAVIVGAGPAGLTAASELCKAGISSDILEKDSVVGGISRTVSHNGFLFDIGGHRFFTKVKAVEDMWHEYMEDDFLLRSRISRILYNKKFFNYPLKISNALSGLGIKTSVLVAFSYLHIRLFPIRNERSFEDFVCNLFGRRLYRIFFKTYTEKVWGIPCHEISAEWAAQRIKGLSLVSAVKNALIGNRFTTKQTVIKTLIDSFHYPRLGPGMMWEKVATSVSERGAQIHMRTEVTAVVLDSEGVKSVVVSDADGKKSSVAGTHFISTMPVRELIAVMEPAPPQAVREAAAKLNYRDFLTVAIVVDEEHLFDDNWIYIHDDSVKVGRIQNFKNWSPEMVPDSSKTCLGLEYFCFEGDGLWTMSDADLIELGKQEMQKLGFLTVSSVSDGAVVRMPKAYPVYDDTYADALSIVREYLEVRTPNLQLVGRNGMHKYNNQDHSMLTAMLAVENICGANNDLWAVNVEKEYHEELSSEESQRQADYAALSQTQPAVPARLLENSYGKESEDTFAYHVYGRLDKRSLALASGIVASLYVFLITVFLLVHDSPGTGEKVQLLDQFFYGYTVSPGGALIGAIYGFVWGFLLGWLTAYLRNVVFGVYISKLLGKTRQQKIRRLLDYI